ncbi:DUF1513 domain-containing protein [Bradyrhizobium ontarionense]|uniref:DUF1513 domain-containing protein n=1 Tax=Bradyrhizobium ontarionense TaxID=2898149 RepID=A0ABY3R436_9BRAD|nr:DUF1513 domain-containing protein [Bradyrhizobium sp. A19]UFZ01601.1 DUF1513 domain-containing protein [Bradyrhizobium sp. A19]
MTTSLSRRHTLGLLGMALMPSLGPCTAGVIAGNPSRHLHLLGRDPSLHPDSDIIKQPKASVLTTIDYGSGAARQTILPMEGGHAVLRCSEQHIICTAQHGPKCLVVDADHAIVTELEASAENLFGGHGWIETGRRLILLPQRRKIALTKADVGSLLVFDSLTFRHLDTIETEGIHPHEIQPIPGRAELAVTHYGDIAHPDAVLQHNVLDPKLTILDAVTFRPKRHYPLADFGAMVTHMSVDEGGFAYLALTQFVRFPKNMSYGDVVARLERYLGRPLDYDIPRAALEQRLLAVPLPVIKIDTQTGSRHTIRLADRYHLRSQSVAYNQTCKCAIVSYTHSDVLLVIPHIGEPTIVTADELGISSLTGVTDVAGTPYVAVSTSFRDSVIYDLSERRVLHRFESRNYLDTHISCLA